MISRVTNDGNDRCVMVMFSVVVPVVSTAIKNSCGRWSGLVNGSGGVNSISDGNGLRWSRLMMVLCPGAYGTRSNETRCK